MQYKVFYTLMILYITKISSQLKKIPISGSFPIHEIMKILFPVLNFRGSPLEDFLDPRMFCTRDVDFRPLCPENGQLVG